MLTAFSEKQGGGWRGGAPNPLEPFHWSFGLRTTTIGWRAHSRWPPSSDANENEEGGNRFHHRSAASAWYALRDARWLVSDTHARTHTHTTHLYMFYISMVFPCFLSYLFIRKCSKSFISKLFQIVWYLNVGPRAVFFLSRHMYFPSGTRSELPHLVVVVAGALYSQVLSEQQFLISKYGTRGEKTMGFLCVAAAWVHGVERSTLPSGSTTKMPFEKRERAAEPSSFSIFFSSLSTLLDI